MAERIPSADAERREIDISCATSATKEEPAASTTAVSGHAEGDDGSYGEFPSEGESAPTPRAANDEEKRGAEGADG